MEWVEAQGKTVEAAVQAAVTELGLESQDQAEIEVLQEPKRGMLGIGGQDAIVKVARKPAEKRRRRRRRGRGGDKAREDRQSGGRSGGDRRGDGAADHDTGSRDQKNRRSDQKPRAPREKAQPKEGKPRREAPPQAPIGEQAQVATEFLDGLLESFGLEGTVTSRIDDDILYLDISGDQSEALVGPRGTIMQAVLELTRTVVQRKTFGAPRMRIDIAGYGERRRAALKIYAGKLADKVISEGGEVMLEPMNPADRKVVHDAVAEIDGVRSFSEGEDPHRSVIIAADG
jgi:spoIIIJ-associated protein